MACCGSAEIALKKRFEIAYARSMQPVMKQIERKVCGCDYGGNSWTTRAQADELLRLLGLDPESLLIDVGAGAGWPGLYLAKKSGCAVALVDLPEIGLKLAADRALRDGLEDRVSFHVADAVALPFDAASFDAVSHSDLLCCLPHKRETLLECLRVVRPGGRMVFSVISIAPNISEDQHIRALANAPDFVVTECNYTDLLEDTGWHIADRIDLTEDYRRSCVRQIGADRVYEAGLVELLGMEATEERLASWESKLRAIEDGLFLRELFVCQPS